MVVTVVLITMIAWVNPSRERRPGPVDSFGLITLVVGLSALVTALMQGAEWGWSTPINVFLLASGAATLLVFAVLETRMPEPLIEIALFRNATFTGSNLTLFTGQFNKIAIVVFGAIYLQSTLHMSPLGAGFALLVAVVPSPFMAIVAGRFADRFGARWPSLIGLLLNGSAILWIGFAVPWERYGLLAAPLVIWGASLPFLYVPARRAVMNAVTVEKRGQAGGINLTAQLLGGTIGLAVCGTLLATTGNFRIVFLVTGSITLAVMVIGWLSIEHHAHPSSR